MLADANVNLWGLLQFKKMKKILLLVAATVMACGAVSAQESQVAKGSTIVSNADGTTEDGHLQKYRRSSLYSVLIAHSQVNYGDVIKETFVSIPTPDKFNSHDVATKIFESSSAKMINNPKKKEALNQGDIDAFIKENDVARRMVAKWFNRNAETGMFDTSYIEECGISSASWADEAEAEQGILGVDQLKTEIGQELVGKTFLLVNDIVFVDKGEKSAKAAGWLKVLGAVAGAAGVSGAEDLGNLAAGAVNEIDGFNVKIVSYLFRLDWNEEIMNTFYQDYWIYKDDAPEVQAQKRAAFDASEIFHLTYIGQTETQAGNLASKSLSAKPKEEQMLKVCTRAIDKSIVELQREYDEFKVNVPIQTISEDGKSCTIPVGLKEGVNEKSVYKAIEYVQDPETNTYSWKTVATLKPVKGMIWDNRFGAQEDAEAIASGEAKASEEDAAGNASLTATTFEITSGAGKLMQGMLVREETIKRTK